jgi:dimethylhistidine N-methyltransferase
MSTHLSAPSADRRGDFASEVCEYLQRTPRQLPSRFFYDDLGSALFEAISRLPWYRIMRSESALLARHARAIVAPLARPATLAELGCGSGDKLATFITNSGEQFPLVELIDISPAALDMATYRLRAIGLPIIRQHRGTYEEGLQRLIHLRVSAGSLLILFLGSNIGNFDPPVAHDLLVRIRATLRAGDSLLLGTDLVKPERDLLLAYDDPLQVTAAFNRNLLRRINDELGGSFDLDAFAHRAIWNRDERRIEMHLESLRRQQVRIEAADCEVTLERGEWIWTESSHKYEPDQVLNEGLAAGFGRGEQWVDESARFALTRFTVRE